MIANQSNNILYSPKDIYFKNETGAVAYNPVLKSVVVKWAPKYAEGIGYRIVLEKAIELVQKKKSTKYLSDTSRRKGLNIEDIEYTNSVFVPAAIKAGITKAAIIVSDDFYSRLSVEAVMSRVAHGEYKYFNDAVSAQEWLLDEK